MREILFRGIVKETSKYQGQWLTGYYAVDDGKPIIAIPQKNGLNGFMCYSETIGMCTGITDKNTTMAFEGDILKIKQHGGTKARICTIYFGEYIDADSGFSDYRCVGFYLKVADKCYSVAVLLDSNFEFEIIGNIFDNSLEELQNETYN